LEAYKVLGYTKESLNDSKKVIRDEAERYFDIRSKYTKKEAEEIVRLWRLENI